MSSYSDFQNEIYFAGIDGRLPKLPVNFPALEKLAHQVMPPLVLSYVASGCGDEGTQNANTTAFAHWGIIPRMLVGTGERDLSVNLFGMKFPAPIFMSPIGVLGICAPDGHGDRATARAAAQTGVPMIASTLGEDPMELVAAEFGATPGFFQLYTPNDRDLAQSLIRRAEAAGFKAIVITLDTLVLGWRPRDLNQANFPQLRGHCLANYFSDPRFRSLLQKPPEEDPRAAVLQWTKLFSGPMTWADLPWLRSLTKLPLLLKGICHPDDARRAIDGGVDGIYCSNHGGRQANDGILPSTAVLEAAGNTPVLFDSGVRSGTDVVKPSPSEPPPSESAVPTPMDWRSTAPMASSMCSAPSSQRPTCSWPSTATPPSPTCATPQSG